MLQPRDVKYELAANPIMRLQETACLGFADTVSGPQRTPFMDDGNPFVGDPRVAKQIPPSVIRHTDDMGGQMQQTRYQGGIVVLPHKMPSTRDAGVYEAVDGNDVS